MFVKHLTEFSWYCQVGQIKYWIGIVATINVSSEDKEDDLCRILCQRTFSSVNKLYKSHF